MSEAVYIPKNNGKYPRDAVILDEYGSNFYPLGGGGGYPIVPAFFDHFRLVTEADQLPMLQPGQFSMDFLEKKSYPGYTFGQLWNGWACPFFSKEVTLKILKELTNQKNSSITFSFDQEFNTFFVFDSNNSEDDPPDIASGQDILISQDHHIHLYPLGSQTWCWYPSENQKNKQT